MTEEAPNEGAPEPPPPKNIVKYYTNKKVKVTATALETIFEETEEELVDGSSKMSRKKFRRAISFSVQPAPKGAWAVKKVRKKSKKAKKNNKFKKSLKKVSKEELMEKLAEIEQVQES